MKLRLLLLASVCLLALLPFSSAQADRPAPKNRYVTVDPEGQYLFVMVPEGYENGVSIPAGGTAYSVETDGSLEPIWSVEGWYAKTLLGGDGRLLIRQGPWAGTDPGEELAIAFYADGVELKSYVVADLLEDTNNVKRTMSHYNWEGDRDHWRITSGDHYQLTTIEGYLYEFDMETGEIVDKRRIND